jgi:uroporphyrinogen decarboxylase
MEFSPDYRHLVDAARNIRPKRLPLYEHVIDPGLMGTLLGETMGLPQNPKASDVAQYMDQMCRFHKKMTYDTVSWEGGVGHILPGHGAIFGGKAGPIQNRTDFDKYPWKELPRLYWEKYTPYFEGLKKAMPSGMKAVGGIGLGVFEISEDLVGYEWLCLLQYDDPDLFREIYLKIGDLLVGLWRDLLPRYGDLFCVCRMGDDLGFKSNTLLAPDAIREHVVPQYKRIIETVHAAEKPFLLHSCGKIFGVMDDIIGAGINAKHSNEDQIAPFDEWIEKYAGNIGLFGGIDVNDLCLKKPDEIFRQVVEQGARYREKANGFALGSGNSIPNYVPVEGYTAMVEGVKEIRRRES